MENLPGRAQVFWSMLDEMAENNPEGYKTFIRQQMKEAEEHFQPPKPYACIATKAVKNGKEAVDCYVTLFTWHRIPCITGDNKSIPLTCCKLAKSVQSPPDALVGAAAIHPKTAEEYGWHDCRDEEARDTLVQLVLDAVENYNMDIKVDREFRILEDSRYHGDLEQLQKLIGHRSRPNVLMQSEDTGQFASLLDDLMKLDLKKRGDDAGESSLDTLQLPGKGDSRQKLIEELDSDESDGDEGGSVTVKQEIYDDEKKEMRLEIHMPMVESDADYNLLVFKDELILQVPGQDSTIIKFLHDVDDHLSTIVFNESTKVLLITCAYRQE